MGLFNSEMTQEKAIEALGSDKEQKINDGRQFLISGGSEMLPFIVKRFGEIVPQVSRSRRHHQAAENLYILLCGAEMPAELCAPFLETLIKAPDLIQFDFDALPTDVIKHGYPFLESVLQDADTETKKRVLPLLDRIQLPESLLPILASLLTPESDFVNEALVLIPQIEGDLSTVSDALYGMLDLYPLGDVAAQTISDLQGRMPPNIGKLGVFLMDFSSPVQKRAVRISVTLAEDSFDVYSLLKKAILADEAARAYTLEILEKKDKLRPDQMDLVWLILLHTELPLIKERGMKFFGRLESHIRPLIVHYAKNGTSNEITCAFECIGFMKMEGPQICMSLLPVYLNDEQLLFKRAGYSAFPKIANMMKLNCVKNPEVAAIAKKMRDYCTQNELNTPTEVMALLSPEELADVIEWSFKRIFDSYGIGYTPKFANDTLLGISELVGFESVVLEVFIKAAGFAYGYESGNKPILLHKETAAAINRLRSLNTPATSNMLHLISRKKDISISLTDSSGAVISSSVLSFEEHRKLALDELERRGSPIYRPRNYLKMDKLY